jgi:hypothetical protein
MKSFIFKSLSAVSFRSPHFLSGADLSTAPSKSDLLMIAGDSEKGKFLLTEKIARPQADPEFQNF